MTRLTVPISWPVDELQLTVAVVSPRRLTALEWLMERLVLAFEDADTFPDADEIAEELGLAERVFVDHTMGDLQRLGALQNRTEDGPPRLSDRGRELFDRGEIEGEPARHGFSVALDVVSGRVQATGTVRDAEASDDLAQCEPVRDHVGLDLTNQLATATQQGFLVGDARIVDSSVSRARRVTAPGEATVAIVAGELTLLPDGLDPCRWRWLDARLDKLAGSPAVMAATRTAWGQPGVAYAQSQSPSDLPSARLLASSEGAAAAVAAVDAARNRVVLHTLWTSAPGVRLALARAVRRGVRVVEHAEDADIVAWEESADPRVGWHVRSASEPSALPAALVCDDRSEAFEVAGASVRIGGRTADIEVVVHHQGDPAIAVGSRLASAMRRPPLPQRPAPREATASRRAARWWDRADVRLVAAAADLGVASWQLLVEGALDGLDPCAAVHATATASELQHNGLAGSVRRAWDHALEELRRADWPALRDQVADLMDAATVAAVDLGLVVDRLVARHVSKALDDVARFERLTVIGAAAQRQAGSAGPSPDSVRFNEAARRPVATVDRATVEAATLFYVSQAQHLAQPFVDQLLAHPPRDLQEIQTWLAARTPAEPLTPGALSETALRVWRRCAAWRGTTKKLALALRASDTLLELGEALGELLPAASTLAEDAAHLARAWDAIVLMDGGKTRQAEKVVGRLLEARLPAAAEVPIAVPDWYPEVLEALAPSRELAGSLERWLGALAGRVEPPREAEDLAGWLQHAGLLTQALGRRRFEQLADKHLSHHKKRLAALLGAATGAALREAWEAAGLSSRSLDAKALSTPPRPKQSGRNPNAKRRS